MNAGCTEHAVISVAERVVSAVGCFADTVTLQFRVSEPLRQGVEARFRLLQVCLLRRAFIVALRALDAYDSAGTPITQRGLRKHTIGLRKIIADAQQRVISHHGHRVRETVAKVE